MMEQKVKRKLLAGIVSACMIFQAVGVQPVYAVENTADTGRMCENHTEHDEECGYVEAVKGAKCAHEHTEDCYIEVVKCTHEHTAECYPDTDDEEEAERGKQEPTECEHMCDEDSGCITRELDCQHEHDEDCGYVEAVKGSPCTHSCELCEEDDQTTSDAPLADDEMPIDIDDASDTTPDIGAESGDADKTQITAEQLKAMIDALPDADEITDENREDADAGFEEVWEAYEVLSEDETIENLDEQIGETRMEKLIALREVLLDMVNLAGEEAEVYAVYEGGKFYTATADDPETATGTPIEDTSTIHHLYSSEVSVPTGLMSGTTNLQTVTMPKATTIGSYAFASCTNLTSAELPEATTIGSYAFTSCTNLTSAELPEATIIGSNAFASCTNLTSAELPEVTIIGEYTFTGCKNLKSVNISKVTSIEDNAFGYCTNLTSAELPEATTIGKYAFYQCSELTSVELSNATTIGDYAFNGCTNLESVELLNAMTIGDYAFNGCRNLESAELPNATTIGENSFNGSGLISIELPKATTIGGTAFAGCAKLTSIKLPKATTIVNNAFSGCTNLTSIELPMVTTIGSNMFVGRTNLTSIDLPSVTILEDGAFASCANLTSIELPSATTLEDSAFSGCTNLTSIELPKVTKIGNGAFGGCTNLTSLKLGKTPPTVGEYVFSITSGSGTLTILDADDAAIKAYKAQADEHGFWYGWKLPDKPVAMWNIGAEGNEANVTATLSDGGETLTISGTGAMKDWGIQDPAPWNKEIKTVVIENGVANIGEYAFYESTGLTDVKISGSVTKIGGHAFDGCEKLQSLVIPDSVKSIGATPFNGCEALKSIELNFSNGNNTKTIEDTAFYDFTDVVEGNRIFEPRTTPITVKAVEEGGYSFTGWSSTVVEGGTAASFVGQTSSTSLALGDKTPNKCTITAGYGQSPISGGGDNSGSSSGSGIKGTTTTDQKKGFVNSITGIITGANITAGTPGDGYNHWQSDEKGWKLQYADGTILAGTMLADANGAVKEQPAWELINGAWYAFGADGYAKSGMVFDPALNGWFCVDLNTGMKTGWQLIEGTWRYFNPVSDGTRGKMAVNTKTPDGYYVDQAGVWDGKDK